MRSTRISSRHPLSALWTSLWVLIAAIQGSAAGQHRTLDLREQLDQAEHVIVGRVDSVIKSDNTEVQIGGRTLPADRFVAEVHVERTLKGSKLPQQVAIRFTMPVSPAGSVGYTGLIAPSYRVLFLKRVDRDFELANPFNPSLPANPSAGDRHVSPDALTAVISELGAVIGSAEIAETQRLSLIYRLGSTSSPLVADVLRPYLESSDGPVRASAAAALLQQNYSPALDVAKRILVQRPTDVPGYVLQNLASAIGRYVKDERAIPLLSELLSSPTVEVRRAAALALRNTASVHAISALALALSDHDSEVRYYGVIGLGEITNQPNWRPLMEDFMNNQKKYLDYWLTWTATHR